MALMNNLNVIKLGSSTILEHPSIFEEIYNLTKKGEKILLIAGGAEGIKKKYEKINRKMPFLTLVNGDEVRYCSPEEMPIIRSAYNEIILDTVINNLKKYNLSIFAQCGGENNIVIGEKGNPIKVIENGKKIIIRDSFFGNFKGCNKEFLISNLEKFDVVCICPPIKDLELNEFINIDADMLAAHLSTELGAQHLRFVTSTAGLLKDTEDKFSTIPDIYLDETLPMVKGRMKQKVRAANWALENGICDIYISGPHTLEGKGKTRFWNMELSSKEFDLINKVVRIPSISKDEYELADFLKNYINSPLVQSNIDGAGNIVFIKGNGSKKLMLLGHIDTVPYLWKVHNDENGISGRGVVDAKGCFVNFVHMLEDVEVPKNCSLIVIGAVEEEVSSSKGAYFIRDNYKADAVIIGEPSGEDNLTLGYYGLFKLKITVSKLQEHTTAKDSIGVVDQLIKITNDIRKNVENIDSKCLSSLINVKYMNEDGVMTAIGILNFRMSPDAGKDYASKINLNYGKNADIQILRATPGFENRRNCNLVKAFVRGFNKDGKRIHYLKKRGTSDMNTLATKWFDTPMVAYGPGDSSLDHTDKEYLLTDEIRTTRRILKNTIIEWFKMEEGD